MVNLFFARANLLDLMLHMEQTSSRMCGEICTVGEDFSRELGHFLTLTFPTVSFNGTQLCENRFGRHGR